MTQKKYMGIVVGVWLCSWVTGQAATITIDAPQEVSVGDSVMIEILLDPEGSDVNALEGVLKYGNEHLVPVTEVDADSVVDLWLERSINSQQGTISFSGLIPGGFSGVLQPAQSQPQPGVVSAYIFSAHTPGQALINIQDVTIYLNDGNGTKQDVTDAHHMIVINDNVHSTSTDVLITDTVPPENFSVEIGSSPDMFDGKYFAVFNTVDKQSSVIGYEIAEIKKGIIQSIFSPEPDWRSATSPELLRDQSLDTIIMVKAIDAFGNQRIVSLEPKERELVPVSHVVLALIVLVLFVIFARRRRK